MFNPLHITSLSMSRSNIMPKDDVEKALNERISVVAE